MAINGGNIQKLSSVSVLVARVCASRVEHTPQCYPRTYIYHESTIRGPDELKPGARPTKVSRAVFGRGCRVLSEKL